MGILGGEPKVIDLWFKSTLQGGYILASFFERESCCDGCISSSPGSEFESARVEYLGSRPVSAIIQDQPIRINPAAIRAAFPRRKIRNCYGRLRVRL